MRPEKTDAELARRLGDYFHDRLTPEVERAPDFDRQLAQAERAQHGPRRAQGGPVVAWGTPAAVLIVLAAALWWPQREEPQVMPGDAVLLAELTSSTHWRAPSDRWLSPPARPAFLGLPELTDRRLIDGTSPAEGKP